MVAGNKQTRTKKAQELVLTKYRMQLQLGNEQKFVHTLFAQPTALIKQSTPLQTFYDHLLLPMVHYIPVRNDLADLEQKVKLLTSDPETVQKVAQGLHSLGQTFLREVDMMCYMGEVVDAISKLQTFTLTTKQLTQLGFKKFP